MSDRMARLELTERRGSDSVTYAAEAPSVETALKGLCDMTRARNSERQRRQPDEPAKSAGELLEKIRRHVVAHKYRVGAEELAEAEPCEVVHPVYGRLNVGALYEERNRANSLISVMSVWLSDFDRQ